jgi:DNA-binding response OmpR family regulator
MEGLPDVVVVDFKLGGEIDGVDAAKAILAQHVCGVIFLTGYIDRESLVRMSALAPDDILAKPVLAPDVVRAVNAAVARRNRSNDARAELPPA